MTDGSGPPHDIDFRGSWINQNGSVLWIDEQSDGQIRGRFSSQKGRASKGVVYAVRGCVNGELTSFAVNFRDGDANLSAITSFSGRYVRGADRTERLHTVWILARQYEDETKSKPTQVWNCFITNSDVFERRTTVD
jgi:Avidin family